MNSASPITASPYPEHCQEPLVASKVKITSAPGSLVGNVLTLFIGYYSLFTTSFRTLESIDQRLLFGFTTVKNDATQFCCSSKQLFNTQPGHGVNFSIIVWWEAAYMPVSRGMSDYLHTVINFYLMIVTGRHPTLLEKNILIWFAGNWKKTYTTHYDLIWSYMENDIMIKLNNAAYA